MRRDEISELWDLFESRRFLHGHRETMRESFTVALTATLEVEQPVAVEEWQPIETAPRDGTTILLVGGVYGGLPFPGKWDSSEFVSPVARWFSSISKGHLYNHVPTHWRPLYATPPSSPRISASSAEAGGSAILSKGQADE